MSPHLHSITITWIQILLMHLVALFLIASYVFKKNQAALFIGVATLFTAYGFVAALVPLYLYPNNVVMMAWYSNVVSESLWYTCFTIFLAVIIFTQFPKISPNIALIHQFLSYIVLAIAIINFRPYTLMPDGNYDFGRTFLSDLFSFLNGIMITLGLGKFFITIFRQNEHKFPALIIAIGVALVTTMTSSIQVIRSHTLGVYNQILTVVGILLILIGLIKGASDSNKTNQELQKPDTS